MSEAALTKLWGFFALALLSTSFLFFLRTTGAGPESGAFGLLGFTSGTIPAVGLPFNLVLMGITLWLTWIWSSQVGGPSWAHRLPIFYFESKDINPETRGGRIYQGVSIVLTLFLPLVFLVQIAVRYFNGAVVRSNGPEVVQIVKRWTEHFDAGRVATEAAKPGVLKFGDASGPEYLWWTPWLYGILLVIVLTSWGLTVWSVFWCRHRGRSQ